MKWILTLVVITFVLLSVTGCQDSDDNCDWWASVGECDENPEYMLVYCKYSCCVDQCCYDKNKVQSFGVEVTDPTIATIIMTLWFNHTVYQCEIEPITESIYECDNSSWTIVSTNTKVNYRLMIDNSNSTNAIIIGSMYVDMADGTWFGIDGWCVYPLASARYHTNCSLTENNCSCTADTFYTAWLCVDNDDTDCAPSKQLAYFNVNTPNQYINNATWFFDSNNRQIESFGILSGDETTTSTNVQLILWFDNYIYQCQIYPSNRDSKYGCDFTSWSIITTTHANNCSNYKMMVDNSDSRDDFSVASVFVNMIDGTFYGINSFCVDPVWPWANSENEIWWDYCPPHLVLKPDICVDNQVEDCAPGKKLVHFDIDAPDEYIEGKIVYDGTDIVIHENQCLNFTKNSTQVQTFGVWVNDGTPATIIVTLWFHNIVYQCDIKPLVGYKRYDCDQSLWRILSHNNNNCSSYKVMIDNSNSSNAVIIEYLYVIMMDNTWYAIEDWYIHNDTYHMVGTWYYDHHYHMSGSIISNHLCVDNDKTDCSPGKQISYFDIDKPNEYIIGTLFYGNDDTCDIFTNEYILVQQTVQTVDEAQTFCEDKYGTALASVHNFIENTEAWELCNVGSFDCYIGLTYNNQWTWNDGSMYDDYNNWNSNKQKQRCAVINIHNGYWSDIECENTDPVKEYQFLCNLGLPTLSPTVTPSKAPTTAPTTNPIRLLSIHEMLGFESVYYFYASIAAVVIFLIMFIAAIIYYYKYKRPLKMKDSKSKYIHNALVLLLTIGDYSEDNEEMDPNDIEIDGYLPSLDGIEHDFINMTQLFQNTLNYDVFPKVTKTEWSEIELQQFLEDKSNYLEDNIDRGKRYDGLVVIVSCHGIPGYICTSDYRKYAKIAVHRTFSLNHPKSRTVPRFVLYDCCQGDNSLQIKHCSTTDVSHDEEQKEANVKSMINKPNNTTTKNIEEADIAGKNHPWIVGENNPDYLLGRVEAANQGFVSRLDSQFGSYLIHQFYLRYMNNLQNKTFKFIHEIFDEIQNELHDLGKQHPEYTWNNDTRYIKFKKNRDRKITHDENKNNIQEEIGMAKIGKKQTE